MVLVFPILVAQEWTVLFELKSRSSEAVVT